MKRPKRGELWIVDLGFAAKTRPCVVLSVPITDIDRVLATIVPHTTAVHGTRFEVPFSRPPLKVGAFDAQNLVTVSCGKLVRRIGQLSDRELDSIVLAVRNWLGLT